jgi:hypothetical protein
MYHAGEVAGSARYIITYESFTERIPTYPALQALLRRSTPIRVFRGFKEKLTVWRIDAADPGQTSPPGTPPLGAQALHMRVDGNSSRRGG